MRLVPVASAALLVGAWTTPAAAQGAPEARLEYSQTPAPAACASEEAFRSAVASRLGADPFRPGAAATVAVRWTHSPRDEEVTVEVRDASGAPLGARTFRGTRPHCREVLIDAAVAVGIALDSLATAPPPPPPTRRERWRGWIGASATLCAGLAPGVTPGVAVQGRVRRGRLSGWLEARGELEAESIDERGVGGAFRALVGTLGGCLHAGWFAGCATASGGALLARGVGNAPSLESRQPVLAFGARVALDVPLDAHLALRAHAELQAVALGGRWELDAPARGWCGRRRRRKAASGSGWRVIFRDGSPGPRTIPGSGCRDRPRGGARGRAELRGHLPSRVRLRVEHPAQARAARRRRAGRRP